MHTLPIAMIISTRATRAHALSALPDAPVVPDEPRRARRPHAVRTRLVLGRVLHRLADSVTPEIRPAGTGTTCRPAH